MFEGKINATAFFLFFCILAIAGLMFVGEQLYPKDGQFFQLFAGVLGSLVTLFVQAVRHIFSIPDTPQPPPPASPAPPAAA